MSTKSGKEIGKELVDLLKSLDPGARQHFEGEAIAVMVKVFENRFGPEFKEYLDDQLEFLHSVKNFKKFRSRAYILLGIAYHFGKGSPMDISSLPKWRKG